MEHKVIFFICIAFAFVDIGEVAEVKYLKNLECLPRPTVVATKPGYFPYFVSLNRCDGSADSSPPSLKRCVPSKTNDIIVFAEHIKGVQKITLQNHTECKPECTMKREECKFPNVYDPEECTCKCNHQSPPTGMTCAPIEPWDSNKCACKCNLKKCQSKRFVLDKNTCTCKCSADRQRICKERNRILDPRTCGCKRVQRQISHLSNDSDTFVGSTTFWVYILIGEFVFLVICFDVILCFKKMGLLYRITRSCRKGETNESLENVEVHKEPKLLKAHYNDICDSAFSSLHDVSRTVNPSKTFINAGKL